MQPGNPREHAGYWAAEVVWVHKEELYHGLMDPAIGAGLLGAQPPGGEEALALYGLKLVTTTRDGFSATFIDRLTPEEERAKGIHPTL